MTVEVSAGSITDRQFRDQAGITEPTPLEIVHRFRMALELKLVKSRGLIQQPSRRGRGEFLLQSGDTFSEGEMQRKLDKTNEVASATAAVAVGRTDSCEC